MGWLGERLSINGTLCKQEAKVREVFLWVCGLGFVSTAGYLVVYFAELWAWPLHLTAACLLLFDFAITTVYILSKRRLSSCVSVTSVYVMAFAVLLSDFTARALTLSMWPVLVLMVDFLLVLQVPSRYTIGLVCVVAVWLTLLSVEESFRFGLLDVWGLPPQDGVYGRRKHFARLTQCDMLPCATGSPSRTWLLSIMVFVMDFLATRGFANQVLKERDTMQRTISTVQEIASLLAGYDVEGVTDMLEVQRAYLPEEMHATLRRMEENLRKYRPYLPTALFEDELDMSLWQRRSTVDPPGLGDPFKAEPATATIVFTDIRSSTWIWGHAPEGMRAGLKVHNAAMRSVLQAFNGYEVKTIGDAFMIAFEKTVDGVNFGLRVHEELYEAEWPASLLEEPLCAAKKLWRGLTVRVGVNSGPVDLELCDLTGRMDYWGQTVNIASRLESTCIPGAVAVLAELWDTHCGSCRAVVGASTKIDFKGISAGTAVCRAWPVSLAGRQDSPLTTLAAVPCISPSPNPRDRVIEITGFTPDNLSSNSNRSSVSSTAEPAYPFVATVGVVELATGEDGEVTALCSLSQGLAVLSVALGQSGGTLVALLGGAACVGWNLTRSTPAHIENAVYFGQRMRGVHVLKGAGIVTGPVQYGDVGARTQRFVTVIGPTVRRAWALCAEAVQVDKTCFFEPPEGVTLPASVEEVLVREGKSGFFRILEPRHLDISASRWGNVAQEAVGGKEGIVLH